MAGGLAQAKQRLQRRDHAASLVLALAVVAAEQREDVFARRRAHGVVDGALAVAELHAQDRVRARRQLGRDVLFEPAEQERAHALAQRRGGPGAALGDRARVAVREIRSPAQQAPVGEVHQAPQLLQPVLDGRAGQRQPEGRGQRVRGARGLAVGVLDRLRLVEDHGVPGAR